MKDLCCLDLKYHVISCFRSIFIECFSFYATLFIGNMHGVGFHNIYMTFIYSIPSLTVIITLAIKDFRRSDRLLATYLKCIMVISQIKYEFFYSDLLLFQAKRFITS